MNAHIVEATIKAHLTDMRAKLEKGLRIARAAKMIVRHDVLKIE